MFVSILQRLGFRSLQRSSEPIQSRADTNTRTVKSGELSKKGAGGDAIRQSPQTLKNQKNQVQQQAESQRRPIVKAPAKKPSTPATPSKAAVPKATGSLQPPLGTQAAAKPKTPKTESKSPLAAKVAVKDVTSGKAPSPDTKKSVSQPASKPAEVARPVKTAPAPVKSVTKIKPAQAAAVPQPAPPATVPAPKPAPPFIERTTPMTSPPALKPGRRSSARAPSQLPPPAPMVPTHAPDAAKASYGAMTERVIAPPPHVAAKKDPKLANNWKTTAAEALTDEEVKAMPDAEYMNEKQMAFFRHKLSVLKQEIHNSAGETTEHLREDTVVVPDPADRATIEEEHALELRTRDRERKLLKKIEQSIARIDSGDYGYCDETGEPIGVGRLIARPTANLSLEAQQRRELKQKMFGD